MSGKYPIAGISIVTADDGVTTTWYFHTTKREGEIGVMMQVPGNCTFKFVRLPVPMNKFEAATYLRSVDRIFNVYDVAFLETVMHKYRKLNPNAQSANEGIQELAEVSELVD